jgi:hypothetical protein
MKSLVQQLDIVYSSVPNVDVIYFMSRYYYSKGYCVNGKAVPTGHMRIMTGTLDADCKGFVAGPTNEIHVKTRVNWLAEVKGANQVQDFGQWPQTWQ